MRFIQRHVLWAAIMTTIMGIVGAALGSAVWWVAHAVRLFSQSACATLGFILMAAACAYVFVRDWIHAQRYQQDDPSRQSWG